MAAYGALVSLMNTVDDIRNHPRLATSLDKEQIESLLEKADFLLHFVENSHGVISKEVAEAFESQIARAAHAAEVVIESHIADLIHYGDDKRVLPHLQKIIEEMNSFMEKAIKVKEESEFNDQQSIISDSAAASSRSHTSGKTSMVGFDDYLHQLLDWLTGQQPHRRIIPITGMGGIGKTTLAKNIYEHLLIVQHFDTRAWVTVSQEYNVKQILYSLGGSTNETDERTEEELGRQLYQKLFGRRYLIILDDMWIVEAWEKVQSFFPENNNGSRIVVTTRQPEVANYFASSALALSFLDDDNSWLLFREKALAQEDCPPELEEIGMNIVKKCRGLPLSLVVIGGLLRNSPTTQEYWENMEKDLSSILTSAEDNLCLNVLFLSYSYLPARLKPCFLYLGTFPEDDVIPVSLLTRLWVAEGFLKPNSNQSLEEVGEDYIKDLVDRSLILVHRLAWDDRCFSIKVHDLLRELCIKTAKNENFFSVINGLDTSRDVVKRGRIGVVAREGKQYENSPTYIPFESTSLVRSVRGESCDSLKSRSELLRVLFNASFSSPDTYCEQVSLRFLDCYNKNSDSSTQKLPLSISHFWNLQTLRIRENQDVVVPPEMWEMTQLRHVDINWICLPDPPPIDKQSPVVLRNLQTLEAVLDFKCSEEVCKITPNIKKLQIQYSKEAVKQRMSYYCLDNIGRFNRLELLHYRFDEVPNRDDLLQNLVFPSSLKELTLLNCQLLWDDLNIIGSLPLVEFLKLDYNSVRGSEWNPVEGEFLCLKFLGIHLYRSGLIYWNADSSHFPVLEKLHLDSLEELEEIPLGIGEIPTLQDITMSNCSASAAVSAAKILAEQESLGNEGIQVRATFWELNLVEQVREIVEQERFPTNNFLLSNYRQGNTPSTVYFGSSMRTNPTIYYSFFETYV